MDINSKELQEYLISNIDACIKATKETNSRVVGGIKFSFYTVNVKEKSGGLKIYVVNGEGKYKSEEMNHIELQIQPIDERTAHQFIPNNHTYPYPNNSHK